MHRMWCPNLSSVFNWSKDNPSELNHRLMCALGLAVEAQSQNWLCNFILAKGENFLDSGSSYYKTEDRFRANMFCPSP